MPDSIRGIETLTTLSSRELEFRSFMMKLAKEFKTDDLEELKYALKKTIPAGRMENLKRPLNVFSELEERDIVGPGKLDALRELLEAIDRPHLISMVDEFDDSCSTFPLKSKSENYLEMDGYRLSIEGGRHFETREGEFVEVKSGANYALTITNMNSHRCVCKIKIGGYEMFPEGVLLRPQQRGTLERPSREKQKFKFFAITDAPEGSGINRWKRDRNGLIEVVFTPERADMKITCVTRGQATQVLACSFQTTDTDFHEMVATAFNAINVTIVVNSWKPLGKRDVILGDYGIQDGSRVEVNLGGIAPDRLSSVRNIAPSKKKDPKWRAGATTLQDESKQNFEVREDFPLDESFPVSLSLRLVARTDERGLPSTGKCTPLVRATLIPPPVPVQLTIVPRVLCSHCEAKLHQ